MNQNRFDENMANIKSYTDLEQSKKLAEILPLESADMHYNNVDTKGTDYVRAHRAELMNYNFAREILSLLTNPFLEVIPCWSLSSLLSVLSSNKQITITLSRGRWNTETAEYVDKWFCEYEDDDSPSKNFSVSADNAIDACYEMIIKLNELKLL